MAKVNKCKVCGETDKSLLIGANASLCKNCVVTCPSCKGSGRPRSIHFGSNCGWCNGKKTVSQDVVVKYNERISTR